MTAAVRIQSEDFNVDELQAELLADGGAVGAIASFVGVVRSSEQSTVLKLELEHYPGMTERSIETIVEEAESRWALASVRVVHRVGELSVGDQIVYVGVTSAHRGEAFQACEFIMDYLKTRAPFWKKETTPEGQHWVDARSSDDDAAARWQASPS